MILLGSTQYNQILSQLTAISTQGASIMSTLQQLMADEDALAASLASIDTAVKGLVQSNVTLQAELTAALANAGIPADVQSQIDLAFQKNSANVAAAQQALADAAPAPSPAPTPPAQP